MHVVLVEPHIATNTGNIIRLCANVGAFLHLVRPLGFNLDSASLRRAGLDYHELADMRVHDCLDDALKVAADHRAGVPQVAYALTSHAFRAFHQVDYNPDDVVVFGTERHGLSDVHLDRFAPQHRLRIPMRPHNRSLNLANAVAVVTYEAWRQAGFAGSGGLGTTAESVRRDD